MENNRERLSQEIDKCLAGELNWMDSLKIMSHTPLILQKCGLDDKTILFSQGHLRNCLHEKGRNVHWHGLDKEDILDLQKWLCQPAMIIDSFSDDMSIIAVSDSVDKDMLPIMACLRTNGEGSYELKTVHSNYLTSIYGRENFENFFDRNLEADFVLYVNREKTQRLESLCELPLLAKCSNFEQDTIIHKSENIVNGEIKPILDKTKIQEFNQKWEKRGFSIKDDSYWKQYELLVKGWREIYIKAGYSPEYTKAILSLKDDGSLDYADFENQYDSIKWILPKEKEFYKNNPDVGNNFNEQRIAFNKLRRELIDDIEYMFVPREDQMNEFYKAAGFIKQKMNDEFCTIAGYEQSKEKPGYIIKNKIIQNSAIDRAKTASHTKSYSSATRDPIAGSKAAAKNHHHIKNIDKKKS